MCILVCVDGVTEQLLSSAFKHLSLTPEVVGLSPEDGNMWQSVRACSDMTSAIESNTKVLF